MNDFMVTFPSETIRVILEYLSKSEHLKCMLVCKRWHERIPDYVFHLWSHLVIASKNWPKTNDCLLRCIGPHTQNVNIDDAPICSVLRKLKSRECNIAVLELKCYHRFVKDGPELVAAITQFGSTLKELHIINITTPDIFEHGLLDSCPNLTHLTFLFANLGTDAPHSTFCYGRY
ncbi:hypothetical protein BJV82DRAFT_207618 [Fennellomyces sp. T-0311]|nr:hypothetical protein BJV82DRAFT_207618 [Fennellomyces sp. T-0311]